MRAAALLVLLAASSATAQGVLSFDRLGAEVAPGHAVTVDTVDASVQGVVKALDAGMLVLVLDGGGERAIQHPRCAASGCATASLTACCGGRRQAWPLVDWSAA